MAYRDKEVGSAHVADPAPMVGPPDWRLLCEQARERAEAAEGRAEELKWAEVTARCDARWWKSQFEASRRKRPAAVEHAKEARRAAKDAPALRAEVARLRKLLADAGVESGRRGVMSLRREVAKLRKAVPGAEVQARKIRELHKALGRSRRRTTALNALTKENARLRGTAKALQGRVGTLEAELSKLRATRAVLSGTLYGRRSEKRETPRSGRRRGQRRGAPGHGRTPRPGLEERTEERSPPTDARTCACCGKPYAAVGAEESTLVEIEVRAHRRVIRRPRWRRTCGCASSPAEVSAPPVPRLFANTSYGTSVWSRVLYERYACLRPLQRVGAWLSDQGMPVAAGTLADSVPRFVPLFEPLAEAIRAHQNEAALRHADETTWRVQALREAGRSARAWLWTSVGNDAVYFHIDPSRSAEAARQLFGELRSGTVIVCDRYSAYKRLARLLGGMVTLAFCWAYVAARIMLRRVPKVALDMSSLHVSAT